MFNVPNGTYNFVVGTVSNYTSSPSSGQITVNGKAVSEQITFSRVMYTVMFVASGLPEGMSWSATLGNQTKSSANSTISFSVPYGTYSWSVSLPSGYNASISSGHITTNQPTISIYINATKTPSPVPSTQGGISNTLLYALIGVLAIAVILGTLFLLRRNKSKGKEGPEGQEKKEGETNKDQEGNLGNKK
jgi:cobalamin biosynthesis Mg chelatase CobN